MDRRNFLKTSIATGLCGICGLPLRADAADTPRVTVPEFTSTERFAGVQQVHAPIEKVFHISPKVYGMPPEGFCYGFEILAHQFENMDLYLRYLSEDDLNFITASFIQNRAPAFPCENIFDLYRAQNSIAKDTKRGMGNVLVGSRKTLEAFARKLDAHRPGSWKAYTTHYPNVVEINGLETVLAGYDGASCFDAGCIVGVHQGKQSVHLFNMGISKYWRIVMGMPV